MAIGSNVLSLWPRSYDPTYPNPMRIRYRVMSGTSMSAAIVSGIIHSKGDVPADGNQVTCTGAGSVSNQRYTTAMIE